MVDHERMLPEIAIEAGTVGGAQAAARAADDMTAARLQVANRERRDLARNQPRQRVDADSGEEPGVHAGIGQRADEPERGPEVLVAQGFHCDVESCRRAPGTQGCVSKTGPGPRRKLGHPVYRFEE